MEHRFDTPAFREAVLAYRYVPSRENGETLGKLFSQIAVHLVEVFDSVVLPNKDATLTRRCALHAFTRVEHYDPQKGEAFNYFATCMLNWLRSEWRQLKARLELEERYGKYL